MSRIIRDFRCGDCDSITEHWVNKQEIASLTCPDCGSPAMNAIIGAPHIDYIGSVANGESSSDAMNTSIDKWQKMRAQKQRIEKRNFERHGTYD